MYQNRALNTPERLKAKKTETIASCKKSRYKASERVSSSFHLFSSVIPCLENLLETRSKPFWKP
ncbi:TPA: hypothetical protein ACPZT7_004152, partial [Yersinia enterocolitica]